MMPWRIPEVEGALNLRDIGGYRGDGGRKVRRGQVYRSGTLSRLTPAGIGQIGRLGIRSIFDLRATREREREPCALIGALNIDYWSRDHELLAGDLPQMLRDPATSADQMRGTMLDSYRTLPFDYAESFAALFRKLAEPGGSFPIIVNCSAGKDRTGIAIGLLLATLGVPRRTILRDYAHTERLIEADRGTVTGERAQLYDFARHSPPEVVAPLLRSDPAYLTAAFDAVETAHGSVSGYLNAIGVAPNEIAAIRRQLIS